MQEWDLDNGPTTVMFGPVLHPMPSGAMVLR